MKHKNSQVYLKRIDLSPYGVFLGRRKYNIICYSQSTGLVIIFLSELQNW